MDQMIEEPQNSPRKKDAGRPRNIPGLIVSLVGCLMVVSSFYLFGTVLFWNRGVWYAWQGLNLALGLTAVVLSASGLRARTVRCAAVAGVVLGAFVMIGALFLAVPALWVGA